MAKIDLSLSIKDVAEFKAFLEVVAENFNDLPDAVKDAALALVSRGIADYDIDYLIGHGINPSDSFVYVDGKKTGCVESGNAISKKVFMFGKPAVTAASFWIVCNDEFVCGWGDKPNIEAHE